MNRERIWQEHTVKKDLETTPLEYLVWLLAWIEKQCDCEYQHITRLIGKEIINRGRIGMFDKL